MLITDRGLLSLLASSSVPEVVAESGGGSYIDTSVSGELVPGHGGMGLVNTEGIEGGDTVFRQGVSVGV